MDDMSFDCIVIGAGPEARAAGNLLARFRRRVLVIDGESSPVPWIAAPDRHRHGRRPATGGASAIVRGKRGGGAAIAAGLVAGVQVVDGGFGVDTLGGAYRARALVLATGLRQRRPEMPDAAHARALATGLLRYDLPRGGSGLADSDVAVLGDARHGPGRALRLRRTCERVTLMMTPDGGEPDAAARVRLAAAGIMLEPGPARIGDLPDDRIGFCLDDGRLRYFDTCFVALGSEAGSQLPAMLGCRLDADGCVVADAQQATTVEGVWTAGDAARAADPDAASEAAIAVTAAVSGKRQAAIVAAAVHGFLIH